eukprot:NODE_4840_length_623_cov_37.289199_g4167_i0.p1 GENE.NODE_4840_length_623_cov_37.289199_g4167_i0~~NODE_4840_length_623_cov_37.289199_g4167_i0.p1  ORF type:complete len:155 (-),score=56.14 NODE_4840_length_623_cov_37.289199_g4167_i0:159-566(-)
MAVSLPKPDQGMNITEACVGLLRLANLMHKAAPRVRLAGQPLSMRAGMAMGPVVGGVIGTLKFAYDFWGDTVNEASRMESTGVVGATQVSKPVHDLLHKRFEFEPRGMVFVKGKGELETFVHHPPSNAPSPLLSP